MEQDARMGFSYSDVLADCDAWLLARSMQSDSSERSLSTAMRDMFAQSETNRIKRFYQSRFKGSADNLVIAFRKLVDGIDLGIFDNVSGSKKRNAPLVKRHRVIRAESSVITKTGKTITSTRNDMIPTRTCEAEEE